MDNITKFTPTQYEILDEIASSVIALGGNSGLIAIIKSWGGTQSTPIP